MNRRKSLIIYIKSISYIFIISLITYIVMAVITHFSINNSHPEYSYTDSLRALTDTSTPIFKFVIGFGLLALSMILIAVTVKFIYTLFTDNKSVKG